MDLEPAPRREIGESSVVPDPERRKFRDRSLAKVRSLNPEQVARALRDRKGVALRKFVVPSGVVVYGQFCRGRQER
jgi:hypothetical protein